MHDGAQTHFLLAVRAFLHVFVYQYTRYHIPEHNSLPLWMHSYNELHKSKKFSAVISWLTRVMNVSSWQLQ